MTWRLSFLMLAVLLMAQTFAAAQAVDSQATAAKPAAEPALRTVAVLDYEAGWVDDPEEKKNTALALTTIVTDRLSALPDITLVERKDIETILKEQELNLTGLTDTDRSVKIGKLLGAKFLLSGRGFKNGDQIVVTTRVINVETGQLKGIFVTFPKASANSEVISKVCENLAEKLPATLDTLAPATAPKMEPIELLKARLGGPAKVWLIVACEEHRGPPIIDPAIENELEHLLSGAGQTVKTVGKDAAKKIIDGGVSAAMNLAKEQGADYCVIAQGFSEFGKRLNRDLVVCVARVEEKIVDVRTAAVLAAGSTEARSTDLGEMLAAKQSLRKGAQQLLLDLVKKLPAGAKPEDAKAVGKAADKK